MKDKTVSIFNLQETFDEIHAELQTSKILLLTTQEQGTGKWGLARLWRAWMSTTAKFMTGNGCRMPLMIKEDGTRYGSRPFNSEDAHELFTRSHLGSDENGIRLSWAKSDNNGMRKATKGERFNALRKHENWCVDKGIVLFKPTDSEYTQIEQEQEQ